MSCPIPFCNVDPDEEPHHHITTGYGGGASFWWDWTPPARRRHAITCCWDADKAQRWGDDPFAPEFRARWADVDLDALFPIEAFWEWMRRLRTDPSARPFMLPGTRLPTAAEHARDVELTQRAFGRLPPRADRKRVQRGTPLSVYSAEQLSPRPRTGQPMTSPATLCTLEPTVRRPCPMTGGVHHFGSVTALFDDLVLYVPIKHYLPDDRPLFQRRTVTDERASIELVDQDGCVFAASTHHAVPFPPLDLDRGEVTVMGGDGGSNDGN